MLWFCLLRRGNLEQKLSCAEQQLSVSKKKIEELTRRLAQFHNCADKLEAHLTEVRCFCLALVLGFLHGAYGGTPRAE